MKQTKMNTGVVRASYLNATTPRAAQGSSDAKYSVQLLIPKTDTETVKNIRECIANAVVNDKENKNHLKGIVEPKHPLHDGDGLKPSGVPYGEECKGHWVVTASSKNKPGLVDINNDPLTDPAEWYSGIYVRANINFYSFNSNGNRGIACGLNHLQKRKDGEPLGGGGNASAAFDDGFVDEESILD